MSGTQEIITDAAQAKEILRTENLVKKYGKRTVVNHVSSM